MIKTLKLLAFLIVLLSGLNMFAQNDSISATTDSIANAKFNTYYNSLLELEKQKILDSIKKAELQQELDALKSSANTEEKERLQNQIDAIQNAEKLRLENKKNEIDSLRKNTVGYPVLGVLKDTLFLLYTKIGAASPKERVASISEKINTLYHDDFLKIDSMITMKSDHTVDIVYKEMTIMSVSETDGFWYDKDSSILAGEFLNTIKTSIVNAKEENAWQKWLLRIGLVILVIVIARIFIWLVSKGGNYLTGFVKKNKNKWFIGLSYKDYTFLSIDQITQMVLFSVKILKWIIYGLFVYITLPIIFSIFPFSRGWADTLFELIWIPISGIFTSVWNYLPNLFKILVIYFVMKYFIRFIKYVFSEIKGEKLKIQGFYPDWAMPTYNIVKFLLYAFTLILIFPFLPGSDSDIFKGVSIFIGVLFSLGSSSAISSMIAGLVITYMRPFKIGDRIKIGDVTGDVVEKTLLITRLKTAKNELITIPNSSILSGNTINYSSETEHQGLIVHTTVTIGYDVPWKDMYKALQEAADRTEFLLKEPKPFILQTSLDDFYVSYQINAYTKEANKQARIYSELHENIQDACNEMGIEILSPHYRAERDGNPTTIPANYAKKG